MSNHQNSTPAEIDHQYLDAMRDRSDAGARISSTVRSLHQVVGHRLNYNDSKYGYYAEDAIETIATAEAMGADESKSEYERRRFTERLADLAAARAAHAEARDRMDVIDTEYRRRGGWTRWFLVVSSSGLIHSSTGCHTCNKGRFATEFALMATLSGTTAADAVDVLGPALCSVCFPTAPTSMVEQSRISADLAKILLTNGPEAFVAAKTAAEAKAAARAATQCPGTSFDPTTNPRLLYRPCGTCGKRVSAKTGRVPKHKA